RSNGIALAVAMPAGGYISGKAALMMLDGWTWEDMTLKAPLGMVINWPRITATKAYGKQEAGDQRRKQSRGQLDEIEKAFRDARAYKTAREAAGKRGVPFHKTDVRWEAIIPVLDGELPVFIWASSLSQIESAVEWTDREGIRMVLLGGSEAPHAADLLKRKNIPVVVTPVLRLPIRRDSDYDEAYTVPLKLHKAGIPFCIAGANSMANERNLPYHAAMAAAFGLPPEVALQSITSAAADILGVGDKVGTLQKGKDATLIVTDGDPLEITTQVEMMFIQGREVDLNNRHKMLYSKYREKYRQQQ
ncbi:amidohydrolase family protein, partial [Candidatus Latescibacterota bacterium]